MDNLSLRPFFFTSASLYTVHCYTNRRLFGLSSFDPFIFVSHPKPDCHGCVSITG